MKLFSSLNVEEVQKFWAFYLLFKVTNGFYQSCISSQGFMSPSVFIQCVCFSLLPFFYHLSFVCKFLTSKVVTHVCSYFKSDKVSSLSKIALFQKSIWFTSSCIWWFKKSPTEHEFIKFLFHLPPNLVIYRVALITISVPKEKIPC
jgi:hypothetical protein